MGVALIVALFVLSQSAIGVLSTPVYAASDADIQKCFDMFNGKDIIVSRLSITDQTFYNSTCRGQSICVDAGAGTEIGSRHITCTSPNALSPEQEKLLNDKEIGPLVQLYCGSAPAGEAAQTVYLACTDKVRAAYFDDCNSTGGGITSRAQSTPQDAAKCLAAKDLGKKVSVALILDAVQNGRAARDTLSTTIIAEKQTDKSKSDCDARIKKGEDVEWKDNNCVSKSGPTSTCTITGGLGWVLCPLITTMANVADDMFGFLAKSFLQIDSKLLDTTGANNGTYKAWQSFRDIANVAFIGAILVIIYSQMTGAGVTNYGIKKLLPRLIIAAILVNASYWICAIAIDLSNILGWSLKSLLTSVGGFENNIGDTKLAQSGGWKETATALLVGGAGVALFWMNIGALISFLAGAIVTLIIVVAILLLRQALIVLLIVLAPIAFVAYLLPNTQQWFDKWKKMLFAMLMLFPIIGLLFGASSLASHVLKAASSGTLQTILANTIQVLPLIFVFSILRKALDGVGSVGAKINGIGDKLGNKVGSAATNRYDKSALGQYKKYRSTEGDKRRAMIQAGAYKGSNRNPLNWGRNAASKIQGGVYGSKFSGKFGDRIQAAGTDLVSREWDEEVKRQKTGMSKMGTDELFDIMKNESYSAERRAAAAGMIMKKGGDQHVHEALDYAAKNHSGKDMSSIQQQLAEDIGNRKPQAYSNTAMSQLASGKLTQDYNASLLKRLDDGKIGASELMSMGGDELARLAHLTKSDPKAAAHIPALQNAMREIYGNDTLKGQLKPETIQLFTDIQKATGPSTKLDHYGFDRP